MNNSTVLIIDYEKEFCLLLESFLAKKTKAISYALDLKDGKEKIHTMNPDVLILDHNLPDGLGIEEIRSFKEQNNGMKIIIVSAMSNLRSSAIENGADYFLEKPVSFKQLSQLIAKN
jgi:DNA-binding response OmpR family regulator